MQPRYGRIVAAAFSVAVTAVALLGGIGVIPLDRAANAEGSQAALLAPEADTGPAATPAPTATPAPSAAATSADSSSAAGSSRAGSATKAAATALPADSGTGRRVVFSESGQRVWLVDAAGKVLSTYLVSGSVTDNLHPGSYRVYSRSRWAVGVDDSGVMQYFVRFTRGDNAAIGFHSIPTKNGHALQTEAQLGTPQSHGCIRQRMADAQRMWDFAPEGTRVVVTA